MKKIVFLSVLASLTFSACNFGVKKVNPFTQLNLTTIPYEYPKYEEPSASSPAYDKNASFKNLTLAYLEDQNTRNSYDSSRRNEHWGNWSTEKMFEDAYSALRRHFKALVKIQSIDEAGAVNADLIAVVDLINTVRAPVAPLLKFEYGLFLLDLDGKPIDTLHAIYQTKFKMAEFAGGEGGTGVVPRTMAEATRKMDLALLSSEKLREFARAKGGGAAPTLAKKIVSDVDTPRYKSTENPNYFALVIGVESYQNAGEAPFSERDAKAVREHLLALGCPVQNMVFLTGQQAGRASIEKYVESWLPGNVKEDSRVFVYFAGHGAPDSKTQQAYLLPWDGDARFLDTTAYPLKRLYSRLNALKAQEVVLAFDAGFSGSGGRSVLPPGARPLVTASMEEKVEGNLVVLTASAADETADTLPEQGHGLFTYSLLKGLNGDAKASGGQVTLQSLYDYILKSVRDAAAKKSRDQTPQLKGTEAGKGALVLKS